MKTTIDNLKNEFKTTAETKEITIDKFSYKISSYTKRDGELSIHIVAKQIEHDVWIPPVVKFFSENKSWKPLINNHDILYFNNWDEAFSVFNEMINSGNTPVINKYIIKS